MSLDTDVSEHDMRAGVFLRVERFDLMMRVIGCRSDAAIGRKIGVSDRHVGRARQGLIGEKFIAGVLTALAEHKEQLAELGLGTQFEDVFAVGDKRTAA